MTDKDKVEEPKKAEPKKAEETKTKPIFAENEVKKVGERDTTNDYKN